MNKIYMSELIQELGYSDDRPVRTWCQKNNILLIKTGKKEFVFESAFKEAQERPFVEKLKSEFGDDWESAYNVYASGNIAALITLQRISEVRYKTYIPKNSVKNKYKNQFDQYAKSKKAA
jgi:hypothetical protein